MFGFLKKLLGGAGSDGPVNRDGVLRISSDDLDAPALLGPKLAAFAKMQPHIADASYDPESEVVKVSYGSGLTGSVYLSNIITALRGMESGEEVAEYLANTFSDIQVGGEAVILPVLRLREYVDNSLAQMRESGLDEDAPLPIWYQDVAPGLIKMLVRDMPGQMQMVTRDMLAADGLDDEAASAQALASLADYVNEHELSILSQEDGPLHQWQLDNNYEASLFFLPGVWDYAADQIGGAPAAIFVARNIVVFVNSADPEALKALELVAANDQEDPAYPIAPHQIWLWQNGGWQPYQAQEQAPAVLH